MARKSIKGYAEKNYYDNTKFTGGVVATHDPLNEGYFRHMVNFDISDMGQSLTPRKGFLTATLKDKTTTAILSDNTIYFYDINLNQYIFLDLAASSSMIHHAWRVNLNAQGTYITECEHIKYVDTSDLLNIFPIDTFIFSNLHVVGNPQALHVVDEYMINSYIIKVSYTYTIDNVEYEKQFWLKMYYRKDSIDTLNEDTLVLTYLDTDNIVNYVDPTKRNLASAQDIIPLTFQNIYSEGNKPIGFVQEFPMIYVKDPTEKYLVNTTKQIAGLTLIPHYNLEDPGENYYWGYSYDVVKMQTGIPNITQDSVYNSPVYKLQDNSIVNIKEVAEVSTLDVYEEYESANTKAFEKFLLNKNDYLYNLNLTEYNSIITQSDPEINTDSTCIIYLVPKPKKPILEIPATTVTYNKDKIIHLGPGGLSSYFNGDYFKLQLTSAQGVSIVSEDKINETLDKLDSKDPGIPITLDELKASFATVRDINLGTSYITSYTYRSEPIDKNNRIVSVSSTIDKLSRITIENMSNILQELSEYYDFYVYKYNELSEYSKANGGYDSIIQTALDSPIMTFTSDHKDSEYKHDHYKTVDEIIKLVMDLTLYKDTRFIFNVYKYSTRVRVSTYTTNTDNKSESNYITYEDAAFLRLFPGSITDETNFKDYIVCTNLNRTQMKVILNINETVIPSPEPGEISYSTLYTISNYYDCIFSEDTSSYTYHFNKYFKPCKIGDVVELTLLPTLGTSDTNICSIPLININNKNSLFKTDSGILQAFLNRDNTIYDLLNTRHYFDTGVSIKFYLMKIPTEDFIKSNETIFKDFKYTNDYLRNTTSLYNSRQIILSKEEPTIYTRILVDDPNNIKNATEYLSYNSLLGEHMIIYKDNILYISKENIPYYFPEENKKVFPEPIVKILQYKDLLLVFTVQNLYAVYLYETTVNVENGTDDEGNTKYVQQKMYNFASLPVLYNIMVNEKYKDAIQVYNQMILFYSADGQMFLIKPTAAIDSNTRFSIQYFNKSANDILLNYKQYIQERLVIYGIDPNIKDEDITIKVVANINYIKIFYNVPGKITYILVYDVLNNRYYSYDTVSFSDVKNIHYTPNGEVYLTKHDNKLYFTSVNQNKNGENVDIAYYNNFSPMPIQCEIDTGTINLNNHLKKRFKDLRVIYKNLDANELEFKLETFVDDIPIITYVDTCLEIRDVSGYSTLTVTEINKVIQLLKDKSLLIPDFEESSHLIENNALFNFSSYSSNKIITHRTNIVSKGKAIRFKMNFSSKGKYKIQGYGVIYKEHTV